MREKIYRPAAVVSFILFVVILGFVLFQDGFAEELKDVGSDFAVTSVEKISGNSPICVGVKSSNEDFSNITEAIRTAGLHRISPAKSKNFDGCERYVVILSGPEKNIAVTVSRKNLSINNSNIAYRLSDDKLYALLKNYF